MQRSQFILSGNCSTYFGWYYPKQVEQFPDKINCVTLHLVRYIYYNILTMYGPMNVNPYVTNVIYIWSTHS